MAEENPPEPIAIIGTACRLPGGASSPSKLWQLLKNPRDLLKDVPHDRFHWEGVYRPGGLHGSIKTHKGYFLDENIRKFDPNFFKLSPAEAENIDPQHRLLLENVYEAIESAGLCLEDLQGTDVGVFVGLMADEYYQNANHDVDASCGQILTTGTARSMAANRISYTFDFRGPSLSVDTACSSSMMAVHLAVSSLRRGESTVAFACGAHLNLTPNSFKSLSRMGMISADGRSKMFDEAADGYGRGEGTAVVCLKRLDTALKDGDSIECIIRETGSNQDGRTKGITMPSAEAQASLIRKTYASAGLDLTQPGSRPSFFEAHGTGTFVGDPIEAQAVEAAFFPPGREYEDDETLYIGSIKTIIGHTEGTAGLAGLLRAALAVRHATIPPNLLFHRMNPKVQPYRKHLHLPTAPSHWPALPQGCPRRASVNSFGFGGSNVHVILESYDRPLRSRFASSSSLHSADVPLFTPFTFSGASERALTATLEACLEYLQVNKTSVCLRNLAWTLQYKRSQFDHRCAIVASSVEDLEAKLQKVIEANNGNENPGLYVRAMPQLVSKPRIMGIFTGQGAQWATMGKGLLEHYAHARAVIARLDDALATLPKTDRPNWKLEEELMLDSKRSRMNEALLAQPLTTAIQILLVDLVAAAGLQFHTVIGHSSGEIAAAYATGLVKAEDAIRIAYYRGLYSREASGKDDSSGGMLAAALSEDQAEEFCRLPEYEGRITVAAFNSPSLVTISGDSTMITRAVAKLESDSVFVRRLQVDKAYHSDHMRPCAAPYLRSLKQLQMDSFQLGVHSPSWFSSVFPGKRVESAEQLGPAYWIENLLSPVRFSSAVETALSQKGTPDLILEIGPNPSLEKPVREILANATSNTINYTAFLKRGNGAIESFAEALGYIWTRFGRGAVDFAGFDAVLSKHTTLPKQLKDLPSYPWQHGAEYWWENRFLRKRYQSKMPPIELLGEKWEIGAAHESKWRTFLDPKEISWLLKHRLNGIAVLPGAAYVAMASTAARRIFRDHAIIMIEIQDLRFDLPIVFPDEDTSIETVLTVVKINRSQHDARAEFFVDFCSHPRNDELMTAARGRIHVRFGFDSDRVSGETLSCPPDLTAVDCDYFYKALSEAGYGYSGQFKAIKSIQRRIDFATGNIAAPSSDLLIHPAMLDGLFQASFAAESFPADSAMPNFRVPSYIRSIKIFPTRCEEAFKIEDLCEDSATAVLADPGMSSTTVSESSGNRHKKSTTLVQFDVHRTAFFEYAGVIRSVTEVGVLCQMEGLATVPFRLSTAEDDLTMFREVVWVPENPHHLLRDESASNSPARDVKLAHACERIALYYLRQLLDNTTPREEEQAPPAVQLLIESARLTLIEIILGDNSSIQKGWLNDDKKIVDAILAQHPNSINLQCIELMGKAYPSIVSGRESAVDVLFRSDHLSRFYRNGLGFAETNRALANFVSSLMSHSPRSRILEVGAGTGASSEAILSSTLCAEYMFTDVSSAFFGPAKDKLKRHHDIVSYKTFDMERDPEEQGFKAESFELVIASNVLHASNDVKAVLRRIRSLLRPGGHLVCVELADGRSLSNTVIMGGLQGWWLGHGKDRFWTPALSESHWNDYLIATGFSGLDCITPAADPMIRPYRIFSSQAMNERVWSLRNPLSSCIDKREESLLVIGEEPIVSPGLVTEIISLLSPFFKQVSRLNSLNRLSKSSGVPHTVLSLVELTTPLFKSITAQDWQALQRLLSQASNVTWISSGSTFPETATDCYSNMTVGLTRTVRNELPHLNFTCLDVDSADRITAEYIASTVLRQCFIDYWESKGHSDDALFPKHTEMTIREGIVYVPSIRPSIQANDRYNSRHRRIQEQVNPCDRPVEVAYKRSLGHYVLRGVPRAPAQTTIEPTVLVTVRASTLFAIRIKHVGSYFLNVGVSQDGARVIALSDTCRSTLEVPRNLVFTIHPEHHNDEAYLQKIAAHFVAERVVGSSRSTGCIVAVVADPFWMSAIHAKAAKCGKRVLFMTSQAALEQDRAIFVHHNSLDLSVRQKIPVDASLIANVSTHQDDEVLFNRICSILRHSGVKARNNDAFFERKSTGHASGRGLGQCRVTAGTYLNAMKGTFATKHVFSTSIIGPRDAAERADHGFSTIVDWTANNTLPVTILPATKDVNFNPEKTYLIIGSSDIACALCEWMIDSGARFILLASRNPDHAQDWARGMISKGASVCIASTDVSDKTSVRKLLSLAQADDAGQYGRLPPIAGVIHLGLVLRDAAFNNMTYEDLRDVTNVKANGSLILHEELKDENLDFFIMTSSISYVVGNRGQANYAAGNAFMVGLAKYRRSLGLPASVVHLGHVSGIGYIQRNANEATPKKSISELRKIGLYPISERDLHHIFAEAVLASPANSGAGPELITGIRNLEPNMLEHCSWAKTSMFAPLITKPSTIIDLASQNDPCHHRQLSKHLATPSASSSDETRAIVTAAISRKLGVLLQMDEIDEERSLLDLGIDSLVAAEIGSWARKELRVQIPNSLIFGGASMREVVDVAVRHLDRGWVRLKGSSTKVDTNGCALPESAGGLHEE